MARRKSAAYLLLQRGEQILLLRRFNTGFEDGKYSLVAGHIEDEESVTQALVREAHEEAGIDVVADDLEFVHAAHRNCEEDLDYYDFFFRCRRWSGTVTNMEPHRCDDLSWFPLDNLPQNVISYVRDILGEVFGGNRYFSEIDWR